MDVMLAVDGMSCQHCVRRVTAALGRVPGVRVGAVAVGSARIEAPDETAVAAAVAALGDAGYQARVESATGGRP